jgi:hypothetical protein
LKRFGSRACFADHLNLELIPKQAAEFPPCKPFIVNY